MSGLLEEYVSRRIFRYPYALFQADNLVNTDIFVDNDNPFDLISDINLTSNMERNTAQVIRLKS